MIQAMFAQDSRSIYQRIKRHTLSRIVQAEGILCREGATKIEMILLLEAHGVDPRKHIQMVPFVVKDQAGNILGSEIYPVEESHASARNGIHAAHVVGEKISKKAEEEAAFETARISALERDNEQLKRENAQLKETLESRLAALEWQAKKPPADPDSPQSQYWAIYRKARDMGLPVDRKRTRKEIEAMINKAERGDQSTAE